MQQEITLNIRHSSSDYNLQENRDFLCFVCGCIPYEQSPVVDSQQIADIQQIFSG